MDTLKSLIILLMITGLPIISANHSISLTITKMQFASIDDSVMLSCSLRHKHQQPDNVKIEWFDGPLPITPATNGIMIEHTKTHAMLESHLIIKKVENFHFGQYNCKCVVTGEHPLVATSFLLPKGTNDLGKNLITNINLTVAGQVQLECNNASPKSNNVSWRKVQFNRTIVSLDAKSNSFNDTISSLSDTGKYICYDHNTVLHISYAYPQDYQLLTFTENLPNNVTLVYNDTNSKLLTCTILQSNRTALYWIRNNEILTSDVVHRLHVPEVIHKGSQYQLQLIFNSPKPKIDAGTYTCVAKNEWETIERHFNIKFNIKNADPFTITSFSSQEYMIDGAEFTASCVIRINEPTIDVANVYIIYTNSSLQYSATLVVEDTNTKLQVISDTFNRVTTATVTIKRASVNNNGTYYCIVSGFDNNFIKEITTRFIQRPVEIINYYKDPIEQHSITCKAHIFATLFMNSTTIKFIHHVDHGYNMMYNPTTITINTTDKSITAHLDLNSVHNHHRYGKYICTTSASLLSKPDKIYSDSKDLTVHHMVKKHTASISAYSVQSSTDQSLSNTSTTETAYIITGVMVFVVATAILVFVVVLQRHRLKHSLLNQSHYNV